jgi:hypothetical protein
MSSRVNTDFHFDEGKPRVDLIPPAIVEGIGRVLDFGATKYGDRNWELFADKWDYGQLMASCERHLLAWKRREDNDAESGLPHLAHAATNIAMLMGLIAAQRGNDDRTRLFMGVKIVEVDQ